MAGFATEYSGMRFGFFFFAEYVNVFIISALTVALFLGGWNAPFPAPHISWIIDPGSLGIGLLILIAIVPVIGTLALAAPFYLFRSKTRWWVALIIGFVLFNVIAGGLLGLWAYIKLRLGRRPVLVPRQDVRASCSCSSGCAARCPASGSTS